MVAPISLSSIAACGPGPMLAISTTVTPVSGPSTTAPFSLLIVGPSLEQTTSTARASPCGGCHQRQETGSAVNHRSEAHTSEPQSLMRTSYDAFCFKKKIYNI